MVRRILYALAGGVLAAALWSSIEVGWVMFQPHMSIEALRANSMVPPRSLGGFLLAALATYLPMGIALGALGGILSRGRDSASDGLASGFGAAFALLLAMGVLVWLNLLSSIPLRDPRMLAADAAAFVVAVAAGLWAGRRLRGTSVARAAVRVGALAAALLLGAVVSHALTPRAESLVARGEPRAGLPNIVFVTIDTLRADHVGVYSDGRVKTPFLDELAREGVLFERGMSQVPHTTPSHISMFTSLYPFAHGARNGVPIRPGLATLPEELRRLGYRTSAFVSAYTVVSQVTGLGHAFDVYVDSLSPWLPFLGDERVEPLAFFRLIGRATGNGVPAPIVNERTLGWIDDSHDPDDPLFLWVHYFDAHGPFTPAPEYRDMYVREGQSDIERMIALYDAEITYTDDQLRRLFDGLAARGILDDAIVVVTSDHGEAFGEPTPIPEMGHGVSLYDTVMWVPMILWGPGRVPAGVSVPEQVETLDLAPTLLEMLGATPPEAFIGRSRVAEIRGQRSAEPDLAFGQTAAHTDVQWYAVRSPEWKLHVSLDGREQLFDLLQDPGEETNLVEARPDVAGRFRRLLGERMDLHGAAKADLDPETEARLRAMGYIVD